MQTLFASGPMNSSGNAYSTIMTQLATKDIRAKYKQMVSDYKAIDMRPHVIIPIVYGSQEVIK